MVYEDILFTLARPPRGLVAVVADSATHARHISERQCHSGCNKQ